MTRQRRKRPVGRQKRGMGWLILEFWEWRASTEWKWLTERCGFGCHCFGFSSPSWSKIHRQIERTYQNQRDKMKGSKNIE